MFKTINRKKPKYDIQHQITPTKLQAPDSRQVHTNKFVHQSL